MKKLLLPFLFIGYFCAAQTPITFAIGDAPVAGHSQRIAVDTLPLPSINFGNKGANQVYDFSQLALWKYDTVEYRTPTAGQLSTCPNADDALTTDGINFLFTNTDNPGNKLTLEGFQGELTPGNSISAAYTTKPDLFHFPTTYQSNFNGTAYLQKSVPGSSVGQPVTTVELTINTIYSDTIDGWGKVITPVGAYKCLRKKRIETTHTVIRTLFFGTWSTFSDDTKTTTRYTYITKEAQGSVVNFTYDTANVLQSVNWSMIPPNAPVANFSFVVGTNGSVAFTDLSDNYPTSWSWNFGDGTAVSTQQNPTHVFAANGNYNVCLTATNAGGSSTAVCKQVVVTGIAATPVAAFTWVNTSGGLVNFTDLSTNTPTSWSWDFGDGSALSTQQNPSHVYAANNTYNVCLTASNSAGSNQHCTNVVVNGISATNHAPVAFDDTLRVTGGSSTILHVASNDVDPDNDIICITSVWGSPYATEAIGGSCDMILYEPDSTFSGTDTCYYQLCDNDNPVLCDTGRVVFTVDPLNHPPLAVEDTASVMQPNGTIVNVGLNDADPDGSGSFCVTNIFGSGAFSIDSTGNCTSIAYHPDSSFTGNDTCWYVICDNGSPVYCDTGILVMTSVADSSLLPVAGFNGYISSMYSIFECPTSTVYAGYPILLISTSVSSDSVLWTISDIDNNLCNNLPIILSGDSVVFPIENLWGCNGFEYLIVCQTVYNQFGYASLCDTTCDIIWEGINEIALHGISLYPNPTNNMITIDMKNNGEEITHSYASIEIYNELGQQVKLLSRKEGMKVVNISVTDLPEGLYVAAITGQKGERRTLGRFILQH